MLGASDAIDDSIITEKSGVLDGGHHGVGHFAILLHVDAAVGGYAQRKLRSEDRQERHQAVIEQIGRDAAGVIPIFAEAEIAVGAEGAFGRRAEEAFPVDVFGRAFGIDGVVPFAVIAVARVGSLAEQDLAEQSLLDDFARFEGLRLGGVLAADLHHATVRLDVLGEDLGLLDLVTSWAFRGRRPCRRAWHPWPCGSASGPGVAMSTASTSGRLISSL